MEDPANTIPSSFWASLNSWFTSTVFFVLLNLMIATIVFTSNLPSTNNQQQQQKQDPQQQEQDQQQQQNQNPQNTHQIARSPSILHRLKSLNFYPQKFQDSSQENEYQQHPLEAAATQYVFNQPLEYQHFDFDSTNSDQSYKIHPPETEARAEHVTKTYDFDQFGQETGKDPAFDFDPTREQTWANTRFDFDPTQQEIGRENGFDVNPTRQETPRNPRFSFDPTREEAGYDPPRQESWETTRFNFDPTRKEENGNTGFNFDPTRPELDTTPELRFETAEEGGESLDEVYSRLKRGGHDRTKSDGSVGKKLPEKMKKSASLKLGFSNLEEEEIEARRPATVKGKTTAFREDDDVEVDSRADDFINKFKNDLKLQRIESIMRTKGANGMNSSGGGK